MDYYVGVTDKNWFDLVKSDNCDEVNFWTPGVNSNFKAIKQNELFLFKLHAPYNAIVGGGFFVRYSVLPTYLAWDAFGRKNGTTDLKSLNDRILKYRKKNKMPLNNPCIGCIILTDPFYFDEKNWIPVPSNWSNSIVRGKKYNTNDKIGKHLFDQVLKRLSSNIENVSMFEGQNGYIISKSKHRLGQGAFRIEVTDAYQRRCAITGEKTLPVLEAAHIKPFSENGPHSLLNGILLKSDFHTLFDSGYLTINNDYIVEISSRLHDDYGNGRDYYKYHGKKLSIVPEDKNKLPGKEFLDWHNNNIYLG